MALRHGTQSDLGEMDARTFNGLLVWTTQDVGESRESMIDRTWIIAKNRSESDDVRMQTIARCAAAVRHLGCTYDDTVMASCSRAVSHGHGHGHG